MMMMIATVKAGITSAVFRKMGRANFVRFKAIEQLPFSSREVVITAASQVHAGGC
jgi:Flp pilus assembly protein CpaB